MKPVTYEVVLGILCLVAINAIFPFLKFSESLQFVILFLAVYSVGNLVVERLRTFFTLPDVFVANATVRSVVTSLVLLISNGLLGGITLSQFSIKPASFGLVSVQAFQFNALATGIIAGILVAVLYEFVLFLKK